MNYHWIYLVVEEMEVIIGQDAYDISQVGMIEYCLAVVDGGYCHHASLGGWILIATNLCQ